MPEKRRTPRAVINNILYVYSTDGEFCASHMQREHKALYTAACRQFGSRAEAVSCAGFDYEDIRKRREWTRSGVVRRIRELRRAGEDLSSSGIQRDHPGLDRAARRRFGTWAEALGASGIDYREVRKAARWNREKGNISAV